MSNNQLRYVILAGIFAIPFVPLIVSGSLFFPFITGKGFVFRLAVEIVFALWLILAVRDREYRPKFSWILGAISLFLAVMLVADVFAVNSFKAFWSNYERMEGYLLLLHLGAFFVVMGSVLKTERIWNALLSTSLGVSAIMSIYSFFQLAGKITINQGGVRVDGTLGNAAYLAIYMVFHIFIAAFLFTRFRQTWQRAILAAITLANFIILYFTATRGAILGLLGGAFVAFAFLLIRSESGAKIRKVALAGLIGLIAFVGLFVAMRDAAFVKDSPVLSRFASLSFSEIKTQGRYYVWPMAVKGFLERPILGWGQEGFNYVFNKHYDPRMYNQEPWFDRVHSTPLDWLIAGGALGLLAYLSIFAAALYYVFKSDETLSKNTRAVLLGLLAAYFFNNLFVFDQIVSYIMFFTVLAYLHVNAPETKFALWDKIAGRLGSRFSAQKSWPIAEALVFIIMVFAVYFLVYAPWRQNKQLLAVLKLNNEGKIGEISDYAAPLRGGMGFSESLEHVSQTSIALYDSSAPAEFKQELFDVVDEAFEKQITRLPTDARYRIFYAAFLSKYGWYGRALEQLEVARELSPQKQQILFELVNNSLFDNRLEAALQAAKTAYELDPSYDQAKYLYGLMLKAAGQESEASEILKDIPESDLVFDDRYITVLLAAKKFDEIIAIVRKRIELQPDNLQHRITLTAAFLQAGRMTEAIQVLEELIRLEPAFKEQGEYYINEIRAGRNP